MTQLEYFDGDEGASYLELAEFLIAKGARTKEDLAEHWREVATQLKISRQEQEMMSAAFMVPRRAI